MQSGLIFQRMLSGIPRQSEDPSAITVIRNRAVPPRTVFEIILVLGSLSGADGVPEYRRVGGSGDRGDGHALGSSFWGRTEFPWVPTSGQHTVFSGPYIKTVLDGVYT